MAGKKRLVLIDAHAILHRAYHALPQFSNSKGEPTGALFGLASMLIKIVADLRPDYLAAAYDLPTPTFRHAAYKEYKEGRAKADQALIAQLIRSREVFGALAIPLYDHEGFEADDILGTIVEQLKNSDVDVIIASGDMDTLQLVEGKRVQVYTLRKGIKDIVLYDEEGVKRRFGFVPLLLSDYKALAGDASDNIKGVKGIGEKTAAELVVRFGSLERIYKNFKKIHPRVAALLEKGREDAEFSKVLATIRRDAPIVFSLPPKPWRVWVDVGKAEQLFSELEFRALGGRLREVVGVGKVEKEGEDGVIDRELAVALWLINSNLTDPTMEDCFAFAQTRDVASARAKIFAEIKARSLSRVWEEIERPLISIVERMNARGVAIDTAYLTKLSREYHAELSALERAIWNLAGAELNINSPKQLSELLFVKLGLKVARQKKTPGGALSTKESELEKLRAAHPIVEKILEYREFQKLLSTYIDALPKLVGEDGRLHANFRQAGTTTGRMSSENPNVQNIPIQTERGRRIRNAFVAASGFALVAFDYSQIELRVAAILSGDEKMSAAFRAGEDIHTAVAAEVFGVPQGEVTKEMRRRAKVINFGILYGMGVNALQASLQSNRGEAQQFLSDYFARFPTLAAFLEETKATARTRGYTETLFGRRRSFEALNSAIPYIRSGAERQATNAPIQGTAADIVKRAMVQVDEFMRKEGLEKDIFLVLQVHDELVYEVKKERVREIAPRITEIMEQAVPLELSRGVPIVVDMSVGDHWGEMKKLVVGSQ